MLTAVPFLSKVKDRVEVLLDGFGLGADVAAGHVVERHLGEFRHAAGVSGNSEMWRGYCCVFTSLQLVSVKIKRVINLGSYLQSEFCPFPGHRVAA